MIQWFLRQLRQRPDAISFVVESHHGNKTITYDELVHTIEYNIRHLANIFGTYNHHKGQPVIMVDAAMGWRIIPVLIAAFRVRVTAVLFNSHGSTNSEEILNQFRAAIVVNDKNLDSNGIATFTSPFPYSQQRYSNFKNVALLLYTSGTTGRSKGVMLTYSNIFSNVKSILRYFHIKPQDRFYVVRSLDYASAIIGEVLPALASGCSVYVKPVQETPLRAAAKMANMKATIMCCTPTLASRIGGIIEKHNVSSLRLLVLSGECLTPAVYSKLQEQYGQIDIWNAYGLTEHSPRISCDTCPIVFQEVISIGEPLHRINIKIVDEKGHNVPEGRVGELLVLSRSVMKGYYLDEESTASKVIKGWLHTADLACMRNGKLFIHGRKDHMMIRGGRNIYPEQIEGVLLQCPGVREALVYERSECDGKGLKIVARVVGESISNKDIIRCFQNMEIVPELWPDIIEMVDNLPKTKAGKLLRPKYKYK